MFDGFRKYLKSPPGRRARGDSASGGAPARPWHENPDLYEFLYERHGREQPPTISIGEGDYDLIGRIELGILKMEGLEPGHRVVDFGCGTGRLAVHLVPFLDGGSYVGIDIAQSMLDQASMLVAERAPAPRCSVAWQKQISDRFELEPESADIICAFSVFTHMEHEDTFRYLRAARSVVRPGGRFVFSCLPLDLAAARQEFLAAAGRTLQERWSQVRNVTTSVDLMEAIVQLAGWEPVRWYRGDERKIRIPGTDELQALGQTICVLAKAAGSA